MSAFLRPRPVEDARVRLIVLHHAGGSAASYAPLARRLPADWDVLLLDLPGRGRRAGRELLRDSGQLVDQIVSDLGEVADDGVPTALFGHSMGALLAAEVGAVLAGAGRPPIWIGLSGRLPPGVSVPRRGPPRRLHELPDDQFLDALGELGAIPAELFEMPGFRERFVRTARADLTAVELYGRARRDLVLDVPLSVFGGERDPWAPRALLRHWRGCTSRRYRQHNFSGGHFYFLDDGFAVLAEAVRADVTSTLSTSTLGSGLLAAG